MNFLILLQIQQGLQNTERSLWDHIEDNINYGFTTYRDFVFGLIIGIMVAWVYHRFLGLRNLRESYRVLLAGKDETISALKSLVAEKMDRIQVEPKDKAFFKRMKVFFKRMRGK